VLAIFVVALLTGIGVALLFLTQNAAWMSRSSLRAKKAFYLAEAGVEDARMTLYAASPDAKFSDDLAVAAGPDGRIDFDSSKVRWTFDENGNVSGITGTGDDVPLRGITQLDSGKDPGWYVAFLTNDPIEGRGNLVDDNSRVMVTALSATSRGTVELVEAILEPFQFVPPVPPAAVTLIGPSPTFDNGSSAAQSHTGNDCGVAGGDFAPIVGTTGGGANGKVKGELKRPDTFSSGPQPFEGEDTIGDLTNGTDPIVQASGNGEIDPFWLDCESLKKEVEFLAAAADYYCNADLQTCSIPASSSPDDIVFIDGDLPQTPVGSYSGVLVVTGTLTYQGTTAWNGVILVVGEGHVVRSGGGSGDPSGSMILANIDPSPDGPVVDKSDWCTKGSDGFDSALYETSGSGSSQVVWCRGSINAANSIRTYRVVNFVQR
jgi:hypothetical protein